MCHCELVLCVPLRDSFVCATFSCNVTIFPHLYYPLRFIDKAKVALLCYLTAENKLLMKRRQYESTPHTTYTACVDRCFQGAFGSTAYTTTTTSQTRAAIDTATRPCTGSRSGQPLARSQYSLPPAPATTVVLGAAFPRKTDTVLFKDNG